MRKAVRPQFQQSRYYYLRCGLPLNLPQFTKGTDILAAPIVSSGRAARIIMKTYKKHYDVYPDMFIIEGSMAEDI